MTKDQYKAVIKARKEQHSPHRPKVGGLIHRLINYRSWNYDRYPSGMLEVMRYIKSGKILFDSSGLWLFWQLEGDRWRNPCFPCRRLPEGLKREDESSLPF